MRLSDLSPPTLSPRFLIILAIGVLPATEPPAGAYGYVEEIWREKRDDKLKAPERFLSLSFFVKHGLWFCHGGVGRATGYAAIQSSSLCCDYLFQATRTLVRLLWCAGMASEHFANHDGSDDEASPPLEVVYASSRTAMQATSEQLRQAFRQLLEVFHHPELFEPFPDTFRELVNRYDQRSFSASLDDLLKPCASWEREIERLYREGQRLMPSGVRGDEGTLEPRASPTTVDVELPLRMTRKTLTSRIHRVEVVCCEIEALRERYRKRMAAAIARVHAATPPPRSATSISQGNDMKVFEATCRTTRADLGLMLPVTNQFKPTHIETWCYHDHSVFSACFEDRA